MIAEMDDSWFKQQDIEYLFSAGETVEGRFVYNEFYKGEYGYILRNEFEKIPIYIRAEEVINYFETAEEIIGELPMELKIQRINFIRILAGFFPYPHTFLFKIVNECPLCQRLRDQGNRYMMCNHHATVNVFLYHEEVDRMPMIHTKGHEVILRYPHFTANEDDVLDVQELCIKISNDGYLIKRHGGTWSKFSVRSRFYPLVKKFIQRTLGKSLDWIYNSFLTSE